MHPQGKEEGGIAGRMGMARDDCGGQTERRRWIVHTWPVHAVMAVHTVYQSNAYRIDFNICVRKRRGKGRGGGAGKKREE